MFIKIRIFDLTHGTHLKELGWSDTVCNYNKFPQLEYTIKLEENNENHMDFYKLIKSFSTGDDKGIPFGYSDTDEEVSILEYLKYDGFSNYIYKDYVPENIDTHELFLYY